MEILIKSAPQGYTIQDCPFDKGVYPSIEALVKQSTECIGFYPVGQLVQNDPFSQSTLTRTQTSSKQFNTTQPNQIPQNFIPPQETLRISKSPSAILVPPKSTSDFLRSKSEPTLISNEQKIETKEEKKKREKEEKEREKQKLRVTLHLIFLFI